MWCVADFLMAATFDLRCYLTFRLPLDAEGSHAQGKEAPRGISLDLSNPVVCLP